MTPYTEKTLKGHRTLLGRWRGAVASIEEYSASHKTLELRLLRKECPDSFLRVLCVEVQLVCFVPGWLDSSVNVSVMEFGDPSDEAWLVTDSRASFFVRAGKIEVKETIRK